MPIKITLANANPNFPCEVIGNTMAEAWKFMADMVKVISVKQCGICESGNILPESAPVETKDGKKFMGHKWRCQDCASTLLVRANDEGVLYIKWDDEWFKYEKRSEKPPI